MYYFQEIIEFPVLKFNCRTLDVESEFHQYVQPRIYNQLTPFCIEVKLTSFFKTLEELTIINILLLSGF